MPVSSLIDNALEDFVLDITGIMCDNILAYLPCVYSILTTQELSVNPTYDPDLNKPWWELAWNAFLGWLASIAQWFESIDPSIKIIVGVALLAIALIITAAVTAGTGGTGTAVLLAVGKVLLQFVIGIASAMAMAAASVYLMGGDMAEALTHAFVDGIFWGGIFAFISSSVNAVKILRIRAKLKNAAQEYMRMQNALVDSVADAKTNKFVTAVYDAKTKTFQYGVNSGLKNSGETLNAGLSKLSPRLSCAETQAVNRALNSGSQMKNLFMYTVKPNGSAAYACMDCTRVYGNSVAIIFSGLYRK